MICFSDLLSHHVFRFRSRSCCWQSHLLHQSGFSFFDISPGSIMRTLHQHSVDLFWIYAIQQSIGAAGINKKKIGKMKRALFLGRAIELLNASKTNRKIWLFLTRLFILESIITHRIKYFKLCRYSHRWVCVILYSSHHFTSLSVSHQ